MGYLTTVGHMQRVELLERTERSGRWRSRLGAVLGVHLRAAMTDPALMLPLWRAFSGGEPVRRAELAAATSAEFVDDALAVGLLTGMDVDGEAPGEWVRATVCVVPVAMAGELIWIASDFPWFEDDPEAVNGPGAATQTLRSLVPPQVVRSVVDLGSGSGALGVAIGAAGDASLVATDLNPRATAFSELTAALNGQSLHTEVGDLTDPVTGRHDLVVCNPPFVLDRPADRTMFRDAEDSRGYAGLAHDIVPILDEDGLGIYLTNWRYGPDLTHPLTELADDLGALPACDVLVLERAVVTAGDYVRVWTDDDNLAEHWEQTLTASGTTHVGTGAVLLRRLPGDEDDEPTHVSVSTAYDADLEALSGLTAAWLAAQQAARELDADQAVVAAAYDLEPAGAQATVRARGGLRLSVNGPEAQVRSTVLATLEALRDPGRLDDVLDAVPSLRPSPRTAMDLLRTLLRAGLVRPA